jgi:hypothetical protein
MSESPSTPAKTDADMARNIQAQLLALNKTADAQHKAEKQPHLDASKAIDGAHATLAEPITKARDFLKKRLAKYLTALEDQRRKEAEEARRAAEEARRAAEKAAEKGPDPFAAFDAQEAEQTAVQAVKAASAPVNVAGIESTRAAGLRSYWLIDVTDGEALVKHFASSPALIEEARKLAAAQVRAAKGAGCGIPGIRITEDKRVA